MVTVSDVGRLTSCDAVNLVLDKEINQGNKSAKEGAAQIFPVFDSLCVWRAEGETAGCPRNGEHQVGDHKDIVPVVIIGRGDVGPSSTR